MKRISIQEFVAEKGQTESAALIGVTQGAISKALRKRRDIYVICLDDGTYAAEEVRPFPSQNAKSQAA
ncbi:hypothetical protein A7D27_10015 [Pseudomonas sp. 1D4]|uniref:Cro/CI family transcriptional regulator n=1 Tax=Pseudomonas sp. 1D4 TaxID=1843691 RepID=UPI00084A7657|nr:Cro/CI family transcriptional regulator [Pseudomonas sp. 1D4]OEC43145.1 hypothetical protein A7D27_10015 [Pseudomonas sp. 1D4]